MDETYDSNAYLWPEAPVGERLLLAESSRSRTTAFGQKQSVIGVADFVATQKFQDAIDSLAVWLGGDAVLNDANQNFEKATDLCFLNKSFLFYSY